jgi:hypothetical protein
MGVTVLTFVVLPLCLIWMGSPDKLLKLTVLLSCLEAAAALTIGGYGLQPSLAPGFVFMVVVILTMLLGQRYPGVPGVVRVATPFVLMTIYAMITSYLMPRLFEYRTYIWPQKPSLPLLIVPLSPDASSINQDFYLLNNCCFLIVAASYLTQANLPLKPFIRTYFMSGFVVAAIAAWQFASRMTGLPFPTTVFFSNPDWALLTEQTIGNIPRINGPFSEPSALGGYMSSVVCAAGWLLLQGRRETSLWILFVAGLLTMLISTSTTGFGVLALSGAGVAGYVLLTGSTRMMAAVAKVGVPLVFLGGLGLLLAGIFIPSVYGGIAEIADATFNKPHSFSYEARTESDSDSLNAFAETYWLGVGWGTNRSSSLIPGLLAAIGVPGLLVVLWFGWRVVRSVSAARRLPCSSEQKLVMDACSGGLVGFLLGAVLSAPTITSPAFFFLLALLIACATRVRLDAGAAAATRRADALAREPSVLGQTMRPVQGLGASNAMP